MAQKQSILALNEPVSLGTVHYELLILHEFNYYITNIYQSFQFQTYREQNGV